MHIDESTSTRTTSNGVDITVCWGMLVANNLVQRVLERKGQTFVTNNQQLTTNNKL